jgi:hypothetical protein
VIQVTDRARAALREGEVVIFDWAPLGLCCACTGQLWLRPAPRALVPRHRGFRPVDADPGGSAVAHPLAYPFLLGRDVTIDCRSRLGFRRFSTDLPPDVGLADLLGLAALAKGRIV